MGGGWTGRPALVQPDRRSDSVTGGGAGKANAGTIPRRHAIKHLRLPALLLTSLAVILIAASCGGDDRPERTGITTVDSVIAAVEAGDRARLAELLQFTSMPCTDGTGAGGPPRCQGEPAGTNVEVFRASQCEPTWLRRDGAEALLGDVMALEPELYAAFETPEAFYLEGRYAVVFEGDDPRVDEAGLKRYMTAGVEADNGLITGIALGCGIDEPVHFLMPHRDQGFDDWLIEPPD